MAKPPSIRTRSAISSEISFSCLNWVSKRMCSPKKSGPSTFQWALRVFNHEHDLISQGLVEHFHNRLADIAIQSNVRLDGNLHLWIAPVLRVLPMVPPFVKFLFPTVNLTKRKLSTSLFRFYKIPNKCVSPE